MTRWRWAVVAAVVAANILAFLPLLRRETQVTCQPEMALPEGLLAGVAPDGLVHELVGLDATWHLSGPQSLSNDGIETADGVKPWRAEHVRHLCTEGLPCALKIETDDRFALLWVEASEPGYSGAMVVQDAPDRRLTLSAAAEETAEGAACGVLAAWFAFVRTERLLPD
ncbi:hypothetical protein [Vannielia litorea]|uniref:Uncharacterized protein n=1 Tax=Vannielia litorea TaxID=1217970 RepID=A0A1N6DVQ9_9RHOB|nr:hypothetical protein [Vannielia litorea]SIN74879.1 hypothetical protein SAMN05444002_0062 [Vannielia litorea]